MDNSASDTTERVWRAVADPTRRGILDNLSAGPRTTGELIEVFPTLSRSAVMKHLDVLVRANLVLIRRQGRVRWNHLNAAPIQYVCDRWVQRHVKERAGSLSRLKTLIETDTDPKPLKSPSKRKKMTMPTNHFETRGASYEIEIEIDAPADRVWDAVINETNTWWLPDFHMTGEGSVVELTAEAGGQLIERQEGGGSLLWYTVHMVDPGKSIHMVGHSFPEWGGPGTTMLKLGLETRDGSTVVMISDAIFGRCSDAHVESLREGWMTLFRDGLKAHVEASA